MKFSPFVAALRLVAASFGLPGFAGIAVADSAIKVAQEGSRVEVRWPASPTETGVAVFCLDEAKPLIESLGIAPQGGSVKVVMRALNPVTLLAVGSRDANNPQGWGAFFDKVPRRPYETSLLALGRRRVQTTAQEARTTVSLAEVAGGGFRGDVRFTFYRHAPLIHVETVVTTDEDWRAIIYDAGLASEVPGWESMAWNAPDGTLRSVPRGQEGDAKSVAAVGRAIVAGSSAGALAAFPPPHQFFYPQDEAYNMHFAWHGRNFRQRVPGSGFGICQSDTGDQRFVPWFNAPPGTEQRLGVFYLLTTGGAPQALEAVARYTHGDRFRKLPGWLTFSSHYHIEHSRAYMEAQEAQQTTGLPRGLEEPGFIKTFKARGVDIVHLAEFHYGNQARLPAAVRIRNLKVMHDETRRLSGPELLVLPGEEPNVHLGGHWISLFPRPVNWTLNRAEGATFVEEIEGVGKVYHVGSPDDVLRLFEAERGLMWTAHPRIKSSFGFPDKYKEAPFFRSDRFLGGAWKAMPADLSRPTLGWRVLDLLDDMSNWGARKYTPGEVDIFRVEPDFETYGHMNINYLQLEKLPRYDDGWQPVLDALRGGRFFTTTGEVLIPAFSVGGKSSGQTLRAGSDARTMLEANLEWTFPLRFAEVVTGDGSKVYRQRVELTDTESFGSRQLRIPLDLRDRTWVRFEVWDVAANGAFTQPVWIEHGP